MKKLGTPIGAGPGRAKEKVGFAGVGTPLLVTGGGGVGGLLLFFGLFGFGAPGCVTLLPACDVPGLSLVGFWPPWPEPGFGVVFLVVVVDVAEGEEDPEFDPDPEPEPDFGFVLEGEVEVEVEVVVEVVGGGVVAVTVAAGVLTVAGGQDSEELVIAAPGGSGSELGGVPGATFWKVRV